MAPEYIKNRILHRYQNERGAHPLEFYFTDDFGNSVSQKTPPRMYQTWWIDTFDEVWPNVVQMYL